MSVIAHRETLPYSRSASEDSDSGGLISRPRIEPVRWRSAVTRRTVWMRGSIGSGGAMGAGGAGGAAWGASMGAEIVAGAGGCTAAGAESGAAAGLRVARETITRLAISSTIIAIAASKATVTAART